MSSALKFLEELNGPTTIGMLVRAYRTRNDMTLEDVGKKLGVSKSYVSDLENDRKSISLSQAKEIAEKLGDAADVYAKVWLENRMREAGFIGTIDVKPLSESKIKPPAQKGIQIYIKGRAVALAKEKNKPKSANNRTQFAFKSTRKAAKKKVS